MSRTRANFTTLAYTLAVSCSIFLYSMGVNLAYPREFAASAEQVGDASVVAPVAFLTLSRTFDAQMQRVNFVPSAALADLPRQIPAESERANLEAPAAPVTLSAPTPNPNQMKVETPPPTRAAYFSQPRQLDANVDRLSFHTPSLPPMAFIRFCIRYSDDCKASGPLFRPKPVSLTAARRAELAQVNREVNRAIRPQANVNGVMAEEWLVSPREGDCNDYAVTKRHELLQRGWPSRALLLAEVVVASGEHHLILVVRTREDDLVLDNLNWNVRPVAQIQYEWVRAQQATNPKFWSVASVTHNTRVAMNTR
jgi:predicted transglutaminase-like cysteine proteinase